MQDGIYPLYKPTGITSAQFLNQFKKNNQLTKAKVGHGGTLDKFADGLLIVAIGRQYTKQLQSVLKDSQKEYETTIKLGQTSTTDDPAGVLTTITDQFPQTINLAPFPLNTPFSQTTPLYSAQKHAGQRASDLARLNKPVTPKDNIVTIYKLNLLEYNPPLVSIKLLVSSGFYVRSFARDLGTKLKTGAYVTTLTRTKIITPNQTYDLKDIK